MKMRWSAIGAVLVLVGVLTATYGQGNPQNSQSSSQLVLKATSPNAIHVFFHGNGQTATDWMQTPDGRPGWAYYLLAQGYVLYMVDYPARGRSAYVPGYDGNIGIRSADQLEEIWTNVRERSNYYLKDNHT